MDNAANTADAGQTPSTSHVVLDDSDGLANDPVASQQTEQASPEAKQDPDDIVLELGKVRRSLDARERSIAARERQLKEAKPDPRVSQFTELSQLAKDNPHEAGVRIARLIGLDVNEWAAAAVKAEAGGDPGKLSAEQKLERLQARLDQEAAERQRQEDERKANEQKQREEQALAGHISDLKGLVSKGNFPLISGDGPEELEANVREAFDLMVIAHNAGKRITHINALHMVEKELRDTAEKRAAKLGYQRTGNPPQHEAAQPTPRANQTARVAPIEALSGIRSDEEIAADWEQELRRAGAR